MRIHEVLPLLERAYAAFKLMLRTARAARRTPSAGPVVFPNSVEENEDSALPEEAPRGGVIPAYDSASNIVLQTQGAFCSDGIFKHILGRWALGRDNEQHPLKKSFRFVEVGAHMGDCSAVAEFILNGLNFSIDVVAFEPGAEAAKVLDGLWRFRRRSSGTSVEENVSFRLERAFVSDTSSGSCSFSTPVGGARGWGAVQLLGRCSSYYPQDEHVTG